MSVSTRVHTKLPAVVVDAVSRLRGALPFPLRGIDTDNGSEFLNEVLRYHAPATPCARLLASDTVPAAMKGRLRALAGTLDPLGLLDEVRAIQHHLAGLAAGSTVHPMPQRDADLDGFLGSLALAWRAGEVRPTHRPRKRPPRHWRTRKDPFETTWPRVVEWRAGVACAGEFGKAIAAHQGPGGGRAA